MKIKVIAVVHFAPDVKYGSTEPIELAGGKFTRFNDSIQFWYFSLGKQLMDRYAAQVEFEIWQPETNLNELISRTYDNGLVYKLFPGSMVNEFTFKGSKKRLFSKEIINELKIELSASRQLAILIKGTREYFLQKIVSEFSKKVPFVGMFSISIVGELTNDEIFKNPLHEIYHYLFGVRPYHRFLKKVYNIIPSTQNDIRAIPLFKKLNVFYRNDLAGWGIDHHFWKRSLNSIEIRKKYTIQDNEKVMLISSRIVPEKQVKEIIKVLGMFSENNFRVIITGNLVNNAYVNETVELAKKLLPGKVIFTGYVSDEELRDIYSITDLMISYSLSEGGPFSIFQAYLMEVPVLQSAVGIAGEMAEQFQISKLVNPIKKDELIEAFKKYFEDKIPKTLDRQLAINYFNWDKVAEYYMQIIKKTVLH